MSVVKNGADDTNLTATPYDRITGMRTEGRYMLDKILSVKATVLCVVHRKSAHTTRITHLPGLSISPP